MAATSSESSGVGITSSGFVLLNQEVTEDLEQEGTARDAVRHIQQARKDADLNVSDRISLKLTADAASVVALELHRDFIAHETLATELVIVSAEATGELTIGENGKLSIELNKQ